MIWKTCNKSFHNTLKDHNTTFRNINARDYTFINAAADNIWDGICHALHERLSEQQFSNNRNHRNRSAMSSEDQKKLTTTLYINQISDFITNGYKIIWCYKKVKKNFF